MNIHHSEQTNSLMTLNPTIRDAFFRDFKVFLPQDATASSQKLEEASLVSLISFHAGYNERCRDRGIVFVKNYHDASTGKHSVTNSGLKPRSLVPDLPHGLIHKTSPELRAELQTTPK
jgi:hypothetical protein